MLTPNQLDAQSKIQVDRWVEVESDECRTLDDNYSLTKKMIHMLHDKKPAYLFTDSLGRLFGKGTDGLFYPFHFEYNGKLIGYRLSKKAAN